MNPSYRRDKDHNYMVLDAPGNPEGTEYQIRMLVGNRIPHLLRCHMRMMDGKPVFFYEITGMQPVFRIYEKTAMNAEDIRNLLSGVKAALESMELFLMDSGQLLFEPEYLFLDMKSRELSMCCLPFYQGDVNEGFRHLAEYMLKKLDHTDESAVILGYEVYSRTAEENYRLSEALQILFQNPKKETPQKENSQKDNPQKEKVSGGDLSEQEVFQDEPFQQEVFPENPLEEDILEKERLEKGRLEKKPLEKERLEKKPSEMSEKIPEKMSGKMSEKISKRMRKKKSPVGCKRPAHRPVKKQIMWAGIAAGCASVAVLLVFLAMRGIITVIQAGGMLFLAGGFGIYVMSVFCQDRKEKKQLETWEDSMTFVLREEKQETEAVLISLKPEEYADIMLHQGQVRIGKAERQADVCISCTAVSRIHARITCRNGFYYLADLNSTNGTYVNEKRLAADEEMLLEQGDQVRFAVVPYQFQIRCL